MGTTIVHPQNCPLKDRPNPNPDLIRSRRRNRNPVRLQDPSAVPKNLVIGQVKILKRGEQLNPVNKGFFGVAHRDDNKEFEPLSCTDPEAVEKQITVKVVGDELYAGASSFSASPPPSSLPFPAFLEKKE